MVGAASLAGILIGATALGGLADLFGRKQMFIAEMALFIAFLVLVLRTNFLPAGVLPVRHGLLSAATIRPRT